MRNIHDFSGRLGNEMFRDAFIYSQVKEGNISDVYVQSHSYFENCADEIKERYGEGIGFIPFVSIHLRRTDYVNNSFYIDLVRTDYYQKALELFPTNKFLVFSDDPVFAKAWVDRREDRERFQVIEGQSELEDLNMMASCSEGNIIANSSFSWWAAYLNPSFSKIVVAPSIENWYTDKAERTKCPTEWIRI